MKKKFKQGFLDTDTLLLAADSSSSSPKVVCLFVVVVHVQVRKLLSDCYLTARGVAASRFVGRQDLMAYKGLVLTLGSMITIPMVWSM